MDNDVRFGEEDGRFDEGNGFVVTVIVNNKGKMDIVFLNFFSFI